MSRRRSALAGRKATVWVERNGAGVRIEDVPATESAAVLADLLEAFRALTEHYSELVQDLTPVPGGSPVEYSDDWQYEPGESRRRVGFTR